MTKPKDRRKRYVEAHPTRVAAAQHANYQRTKDARNEQRRLRRRKFRASADLPRWDKCGILFVTLDDISNIEEYDTLAVPLPEDLAENDLRTPYLANLQKRLGDGFVAPSTLERRPMLHQGILMMEILRSSYGQDVCYMKMKEIIKNCRERHAPFSGAQPLLVFLYQTTYNFSWAQAHQIFDELEVQGRPIRIYPRRTELVWDTRKLADIEVLDQIAQDAENERFRYRPITCWRNEPCLLVGHEKTIQKRSTSCGSRHVKEIRSSRQLQCTTHVSKRRHQGTEVYFHQKYVPSFSSFGELRVFVLCERDNHGLRGRVARVIHMIRTWWDENGNIAALNATPTDAYWKDVGGSYEEVCRLVLHNFDIFRNRDDWEEHYESFDVGGRVDVGISDDGRPFVSELTRWYAADLFSWTTLDPPYTLLCSRYATALQEYINSTSYPIPCCGTCTSEAQRIEAYGYLYEKHTDEQVNRTLT